MLRSWLKVTAGGHLPHAVHAKFNCKNRKSCLKGTRTAVLTQFSSWIGIKDLFDESLPPPDTLLAAEITGNRNIFWINGSAGTGKTTIAHTIAEECHRRGFLGASFFCSRDDADCSNPFLIFTTLAYQLGLFCPELQQLVDQVLKSNPDIGYSVPSYQLEELIVKPLRQLGDSFQPCIIILDALDECKDDGAISIILSALSRYVDQLSRLRILVTSRPEPKISAGFKSDDLRISTKRLALHEVQLAEVENDIARYLDSALRIIHDYYYPASTWPSAEDVQALVQLSSGLFIFAATSIRFIEDKTFGSPRGQLAAILGRGASARHGHSPQSKLDSLYTELIVNAFSNISAETAARFRKVLGSIVILQDPLSPISLEQLLGLNSDVVRETLLHLQSVIILPDDDVDVARLIHPSFFDFLTDSNRCKDARFAVNAQAQHTLLARKCLDTMECLHSDMSKLMDPTRFSSEVAGLSTQISSNIPFHLQYSCRHWAFHFERSLISDSLLDHLNQFCLKHLLHWLEVCSLLGELRGALVGLHTVQDRLRASVRQLNLF